MDYKAEFAEKRRRILDYVDRKGLDGVLVSRIDNFAWATAGCANYIPVATDVGLASLLITPSKSAVITTNIEATRIRAEEPIAEVAEVRDHTWHDDDAKAKLMKELVSKNVAVDVPLGDRPLLGDDFVDLQARLTPREVEQYKQLGHDASEAIEAACYAVEKGQREIDIAARLRMEAQARDLTPTVCLIAADERLKLHRHPLPTHNKVEKVVMLVLCARRRGLIASLTRLVHFGPIDDDLKRRHEAVTRVDAVANLASDPGIRIGSIFDAIVTAYGDTGFRGEENNHHQGGPTGYRGRYYTATSRSAKVVEPNQAFAWNPSIAGTKSEDTIIAGETGPIEVTRPLTYPTIDVTVEGHSMRRAAILEK